MSDEHDDETNRAAHELADYFDMIDRAVNVIPDEEIEFRLQVVKMMVGIEEFHKQH